MKIVVCALLHIVLLAACGTAEDREMASVEGSAGEWPVGQVVNHLEFGRILFHPEPGISWTELVNLSAFEGFWPGMTGEDAVRAIGEPDEYHERDGERYWHYRKPGREITIALKHKGSLFAGRWWRLEARFDPPAPVARLLHSSVAQELPQNFARFTAVIMNNEGRPAVSAFVENGKIVRMDWIDNPGSELTETIGITSTSVGTQVSTVWGSEVDPISTSMLPRVRYAFLIRSDYRSTSAAERHGDYSESQTIVICGMTETERRPTRDTAECGPTPESEALG